MLNPAFTVLKREQAFLHTLRTRFNLEVESRAFIDTQDPYLLLTIPVPKNSQLSFNGKLMNVLDHHFTIAQFIDKKTSNSQYHYSLYLQDSEQKKYRVHLYCDKLDRIIVEPKLYVLQGTQYQSLSAIEASDMNKMLDFSLQYTGIISAVREHQNKIIAELVLKVQQTEEQLSNLRQQLSTAKSAYLKLCAEQIECIRLLTSLGNLQFARDKRFFQSEIVLLTRKEAITPIEPVMLTQEAATDERDNAPVPMELVITTKSKSKKKKATKDVTKSPTELISLCTKLRAEFDIAFLKDKQKSPIEAMINAIFSCQEIAEFPPANQAEIFELKRALLKRIALFFRTCELSANIPLFLLAVRGNILQVSNKFIEEMIVHDNVQLLKGLLELNVLAESNRYCFAGKSLSLIEACVQYKSAKCFCALMAAGFSLDYLSEDNSPLMALVEDYSLYFDFIRNYNLSVDARNRLKNRIVLMLQVKIDSATDINQLKLYQLKLHTIELNSMILRFLESRPSWKKIISDDAQINGDKLNAFFEQRCDKAKLTEFREILRSDVEVLEASMELMEATQNLLMALESKPVNALHILKMLFKISDFKEQKDPAYVVDVECLKKELINIKKQRTIKIKAYTKIIKNENTSNTLLKIRRYEAESKKSLMQEKNELIKKAEEIKANTTRLQNELLEIQEVIRLEEMKFRMLTLQDNPEPSQKIGNNLLIAKSQQQEGNLAESSNAKCTSGAEALRKPN